MKSQSTVKQFNSMSSYIESLITHPAIPNPLKKSASQKKINDSLIGVSQISPSELRIPTVKISPLKKRSHSEDRASQLFENYKNYAENPGAENSMILSHISELTEPAIIPKQVKFRENLIMKNSHNRRENTSRQARTPSILKKSQLLRNNCAVFMQQNSQINAQRYPSSTTQDRQERAKKTNEVVKRRYFSILQRFQAKFATKLRKNVKIRSDQKYQDDLFPPITSSILRGGNKNQQNYTENIRWVRITQLFKQYNLTVIDTTQRSNLLLKCSHCSNFIGDAFNCIRNSRSILSKMFQSTQVNEFGVYLIKIFQQNVWKYVIVDDYIPVQVNQQGHLHPYFINCKTIDDNGSLQIWPFLLEKAYANYYANYQSLHFGNTFDFLQEITGLSAQVFHFISNKKKYMESMNRFERLVSLENIILLGFIQSENLYVPLQRNLQGKLAAYLSKQQTIIAIQIEQIYQYFDKIYVINPGQLTNSSVSTIGINIKKTQNLFRFDISLRTIKLSKPGTVSLSIRQKQKRFYQRSSLNYDYIWVRVILLKKEFDSDCRWVDAKYSNNKSITFLRKMQAGEYYVILMPEWKSSHCYQLSLIVNSNEGIVLSRRQYDDSQQLVEKGCCDLSQRLGRLYQINLYACSYTYISQEIGMLFENIVNQRYQGDIRINRSIAGLKATVDLVPFNRQFYVQKNPKTPFNSQLSVYIPADKSFTVILMMRGGVDLPFLRKFDFGK